MKLGTEVRPPQIVTPASSPSHHSPGSVKYSSSSPSRTARRVGSPCLHLSPPPQPPSNNNQLQLTLVLGGQASQPPQRLLEIEKRNWKVKSGVKIYPLQAPLSSLFLLFSAWLRFMALQQNREEAKVATTKNSAEIFLYHSNVSIFPSVRTCSSLFPLSPSIVSGLKIEELFFRLFSSHVADSFYDPGCLVRPLPFLGAGACVYQGIFIYQMDPHL